MISIIIPCYNGSKFIDKCLDSVYNQTVKDWECIIINDGSTDNSEEILKKWEAKDNRFEVISIKNRGVSNARNLGITKAKGEYLFFIDIDDQLSDLHALQSLLLPLEESLFDVIIGKMENTKLNKISFYNQENSSLSQKEIIKNPKDIFSLFLKRTFGVGPCAKLYKREILKRHNIFFPEDLVTGEDFIFNLNFFFKIKTCCYLDRVVYYYYRNNNNSCTSNPTLEHANNYYYITEYVLNFYSVNKSDLEESSILITLEILLHHLWLYSFSFNNYPLYQEYYKKVQFLFKGTPNNLSHKIKYNYMPVIISYLAYKTMRKLNKHSFRGIGIIQNILYKLYTPIYFKK